MMKSAVNISNTPVTEKTIAVVTPSRSELHPKESIFIYSWQLQKPWLYTPFFNEHDS